MTVDLSGILPDLTYGIGSQSYNGIMLPAGVNFVPAVPTPCRGCVKAADGAIAAHRCHTALRIGETDQEVHDSLNTLINLTNATNLWYRRLSKLVQVMNEMYHRVGISQQNLDNTSQRFTYPVVYASHDYVDLRWDGASENNPNNITFAYFHENGEWEPGVNNRYITDYTYGKIPARGWLTIGGTSILSNHAPWLISHIQLSSSLGAGGTFRVYLDTPISDRVLELEPCIDPPSPVTARLEFYIGGWNALPPCPRDVNPLWGLKQTFSFALPFVELPTISGLCRYHSNDSKWLSARKKNTATQAWETVSTALLFPSFTTAYSDGWTTVFYLDNDDFTGYDALEITAFVYDAVGLLVGQHSCVHDRVDYSGSYGTLAADRWNHFCNDPTCAKYSAYIPGGCYFPNANEENNHWLEDTVANGGGPSTPVLIDGWKQVTHSIAWIREQIQAGLTASKFKRKGCYSLMNVCPTSLGVPITNTATKFPYAFGGWQTVGTATIGGLANCPYKRHGIEMVWETATIGPAGNNISPRLQGIGTDAETRDINKSQITMGSVDLDPCDMITLNDHGRFQLCGYYKFDLVVPRIRALEANTFIGGTLEFGYWNQYGEVVETYEAATFGARLKITDNFDPINRGSAVTTHNPNGLIMGGIKRTATVVRSESLGGGLYKLHLENNIIQCAAIQSGQDDIVTAWKSAGTLVAMPDPFRINNYLTASGYGRRGPLRDSTIQVGDGCKFTDAAVSDRIQDKIFEVTAVAPADGDVQNWTPDSMPSIQRRGLRTYYHTLNAGETVTSITITRDSGAVTLTAIHGYPFAITYIKDVYGWEQRNGYDDNENEVRQVLIKFSHLNMTSLDADKLVHVSIVTDGATHTADIDVSEDEIFEDYIGHFVITNANVISNPVVNATYTDPLTLLPVTVALEVNASWDGYLDSFATPFLYAIEYSGGPGAYQADIWIAPQLQGSNVVVQVDIDDPWTGTQDQYYAAYIDPLQGASLPTLEYSAQAYSVWGRKSDTVVIKDALGLIAAENGGDLAGLVLSFGDIIHFHETENAPRIFKTQYNNTSADDELTVTTDYTTHGANGDVWFGKLLTWADDDCLFLNDMPLRMSSCPQMWKELYSIRAAAGKMLST